jgi:hypothetical protein
MPFDGLQAPASNTKSNDEAVKFETRYWWCLGRNIEKSWSGPNFPEYYFFSTGQSISHRSAFQQTIKQKQKDELIVLEELNKWFFFQP